MVLMNSFLLYLCNNVQEQYLGNTLCSGLDFIKRVQQSNHQVFIFHYKNIVINTNLNQNNTIYAIYNIYSLL